MPSFFLHRNKMPVKGASCNRECFALYKEKGIKERKIGVNVDRKFVDRMRLE